ncbi:tRNA lysidine(34) synthetase TilS [Candidatus Erwinia haradaeae]|uniref:tRNA(Ile)-lysidine synthase n=1 Tax=Candidatus Erwinia haradaeae TaxID=1922217 RepID=A0A451D3R3_9GAMM|nr:tRNA lysidine(34) synthetase TilS [Candidatus Erwinia haradaeae]VFP80333.1 tRNA(Ile)-lysidine synthase [Candidatus Erwinia haradaeae]
MSSITYLKNLLINEHAIIIAYSGGLDSTVLLHHLVQLKKENPFFKFKAIHIHHGLHDLADSWATHCKIQCDIWEVPLIIQKVQVKNQKYKGIEATARQIRYQALYKNMQPNETLLTAQHQDDQTETFILALKRGSGPTGLASMTQIKLHGRHRHIRPFLNKSQLEIKEWAIKNTLSWVTDPSNQDIRYDRNFLRSKIIPLLNKRWPYFSRTVSRSAQLCNDQEKLLDEFLLDILNNLIDQVQSLNFIPLKIMSHSRRFALLRRWIQHQKSDMPSSRVLQNIWEQVACSRQDANPCLKIGNHEVRRFHDRLYWLPIQESLSHYKLIWEFPWNSLILPDKIGHINQCNDGGIVLRRPSRQTKISIRFHAQGKFYILGRTGSRSLKKLWQEYKIPPWQRTRIPLIFYNNSLIAALGIFVTIDGTCISNKEYWRVIWVREKFS